MLLCENDNPRSITTVFVQNFYGFHDFSVFGACIAMSIIFPVDGVQTDRVGSLVEGRTRDFQGKSTCRGVCAQWGKLGMMGKMPMCSSLVYVHGGENAGRVL